MAALEESVGVYRYALEGGGGCDGGYLKEGGGGGVGV